jgi:hypothetical protein
MKKSFPLRLDERVYRLLQKWAEDELRSVNGQIEYVLQQGLKGAGRWPADRSAPGDKSTGRGQ